MKPLSWPLLADENISSEVVALLREQGKNVRTVHEEGLAGASDTAILRRAIEQRRVVLSHDSDFGTLAIHRGEPYLGIIYLRPGHIAADFVMTILTTLDETVSELHEPFIIVAERRGVSVRIRARTRGPSQ